MGRASARIIAFSPASVVMLVALVCGRGACADGGEFRLPAGLLPFQFEMTQRFEPFGGLSRYGLDRFSFSGKVRSGSFRYSSSSPAPLSGKQFTAVPSGYSILEGSYKLGKNLLSGFRSTGHDPRRISGAAARSISGIVTDIPLRSAGLRVSGYYIRATPTIPKGAIVTAPESSQAGVNLERSFGKRLKLQSEWTRSFRDERPSGPRVPSTGIYLKLSGRLAATEATLLLRTEGRGLQNPAAPAQGRGRRLDVLEAGRAFGKVRVRYSRQGDFHGDAYLLHQPLSGSCRQTLAWTFALVRVPQVTVARTWVRQRTGAKLAGEESLRLGTTKGIKRLLLGLGWQRGRHRESLSENVTWERSGITGDASVPLAGNDKLNLHYEKGTLKTPSASQVLQSSVIQLNTKVAPWGDRISLAPALDCRRQRDVAGVLDSRAIGVLLAAAIRLPKCVPGVDLLVRLSSRRADIAGMPPQTTNALQVYWNLKRQ